MGFDTYVNFFVEFENKESKDAFVAAASSDSLMEKHWLFGLLEEDNTPWELFPAGSPFTLTGMGIDEETLKTPQFWDTRARFMGEMRGVILDDGAAEFLVFLKQEFSGIKSFILRNIEGSYALLGDFIYNGNELTHRYLMQGQFNDLYYACIHTSANVDEILTCGGFPEYGDDLEDYDIPENEYDEEDNKYEPTPEDWKTFRKNLWQAFQDNACEHTIELEE